jgi:hypothetical protein
MSFKPEVEVEGKWARNGLVFSTREEAEANAANLYSRWTLTTGHRAVEVDEAGQLPLDRQRAGGTVMTNTTNILIDPIPANPGYTAAVTGFHADPECDPSGFGLTREKAALDLAVSLLDRCDPHPAIMLAIGAFLREDLAATLWRAASTAGISAGRPRPTGTRPTWAPSSRLWLRPSPIASCCGRRGSTPSSS